ncbi:MAG: PD40 domain-containing protein [Cyclobacteriaceae bacterium]|nr:PD40 domain-containing protein [Cyclobacteriaceae bacterium]
MQSLLKKNIFLFLIFLLIESVVIAQGTRLLRQPSLSANHVAFSYGGDIWVTELSSQKTLRLTSTPAVEGNPHLSPDGKWVAFNSNRSGNNAVYIVSIEGGTPKRLTWHPSASLTRGWSTDGKHVLFATPRETAPAGLDRLWTVSIDGGPSTLLTKQWGTDGSYSPDGKQIVIDRVHRWDVEWRNYRGGQNTPLVILNLADQTEKLIPNESTFDIQPLWLGDKIYFLSDRDWTSNIWSYTPASGELKQITQVTGSDIKWLGGYGNKLVFEHDGYLHLHDLTTNETKQLSIDIQADFPWAETKWEDVTKSARAVSLSATGKRAIMEARGEIFTIPVEHGDARNMTLSSGAADHAPIWSPKGNEVAWFSDVDGKGYALMIAAQDGLTKPRTISIGESKMAWEPTWSPDGKLIAFADDDVRIRVVEMATGTIKTVDVGGANIERGDMGLTWSPDSKWLAYSKSGSNNFKQIIVWSVKDNNTRSLTNSFADSNSPAWDRDGRHLYFLATTELALASGWANTSSMMADPNYAAYVINLRKEDLSPFKPRSDEESSAEEKKPEPETKKPADKKSNTKKPAEEDKEKPKEPEPVIIDFDNIERRTIALPLPKAGYRLTLSGPAGTVFIGEQKSGNGIVLHKFTLEKREAKEFISGASQISVSGDGNKMLAKVNNDWKVLSTTGANGNDGTSLKFNLKVNLSRAEEWKQIFEEAWRYERDYFYDPNMHGRNWTEVHERYAPLIPFVKHRTDLSYVLDQVNGELSVGHSFVFGGDFPEVDKPAVGLLGADLVAENKRWKINRIYTTESWNPELSSPLDRPGIKIQEGNYLVGINGKELTDADDPFQFLDGTVDVQTTLHINKTPDFAGAWQEVVKPIASEDNLRQRGWVEDNRRMVDKLSNGKLAYVWVPNTSGNGFVSFNRYFFAQQDKKGVVIDERFNGGGLLDDYMVDLMNRKLRAALTNEVPNGTPFRLPAGILGPKVLLINEMAGSGGDFFPWVFRQQKTGPLIGARTWGGLVKSSVHYSLVDGGALTAPDNAVFDPINNKWVAENEGVAPDIEVRQDAVSLSKGIDAQLERAVKEALKLLEEQGEIKITPPPFSTPAKKKN